MQNRAAQHNYRMRQQNLVSGLQAERDKLRKENLELKRALAQIERFTMGWQLSRDGTGIGMGSWPAELPSSEQSTEQRAGGMAARLGTFEGVYASNDVGLDDFGDVGGQDYSIE